MAANPTLLIFEAVVCAQSAECHCNIHYKDAQHKNVIQVAEKAEPDVVEDEGAPEEELGFEPPNVRVTVAGVPTEEPKAIVTLEANKVVPNIILPV